MLFVNSGAQPRRVLPADPHPDELAGHAVWIDLIEPTEEERAAVERASGLRVPSHAELAEIEQSSRLSAAGGVLTLSTPVVSRTDGAAPLVSPLGFVLSRERLLTVRYAGLTAFDSFASSFGEAEGPGRSAVGAFIGLLEAIVDRLADILERVGGELDEVSHRVFRTGDPGLPVVRRADAQLQEQLRAIGRGGDLVSNLGDTLLGVGRIVAYAAEMAADWTPAELKPRYATLRRDIRSLQDYDAQLTNKVQFLLDATLGFINIQQNNGIKVLTVVSVVGVPPTLVASIYGMNFKNIPELNWAWGYEYGLAVIALSALLPLLWFWRRGWI